MIWNSAGSHVISFNVLRAETAKGICCISFNGFLEQHNFIYAVSEEFCYPMPNEVHDFHINSVASRPF